MRGTVQRLCWCRDPVTRKQLHGKCPKLKKKDHGAWYVRYDAPRAQGERRRQPLVGPFSTKKQAEEELAALLARLGGGGSAPDRSMLTGAYLDAYAAGKIDVKPRTQADIAEAIALYWKPALGHLRLVDLRDFHVAEAVRTLQQINVPPPDGERPSEMLRRMLEVRALSPRKGLAPGDMRRKSTKPLSPARIKRVFAVLHAAMEAAVPGRIAVNPCDGVILPRVTKVRPLPWTPEREEAFRAALDRQERESESAKGRRLTTVERQELWAQPQLRPVPVMVWMPAHTGAFLDYLEDHGERLIALFCLVVYCGLRRDEVVGLAWSEVSLDQGVAYVRETGTGNGPKSDAGVRAVPLPAPVVAALRAWRKVQAADRLAWGPDWPDSGLVFTREDGTGVPGQWVSVRFETLAFRAGLPAVRFHDLRHGAASLCKAAGLDTKFISALLGHSRTSFTDDTYVLLFPEVARAAAESAAAIVPRRPKAASENGG
jgi:integrase